MDRGLIDWQTTVCEAAELCVCTSGDNIQAPQGTVLSPFLFTIYTSDFKYNSESCYLRKFSKKYRVLMDHFVKWCGENHFQLNKRDHGGFQEEERLTFSGQNQCE